MSFFLRHVREEFPDDFILMVYDGAPCHRGGSKKLDRLLRWIPDDRKEEIHKYVKEKTPFGVVQGEGGA